MANEEKKKDAGSITLLNRGQRTFKHGFAKNDDGTPNTSKPLDHAPGAPFTYSAEEGAKMLKMYPRELYDVSKLPGVVDSRQLEADKKALVGENAALKARLAELEDAAKEKGGKEKVKA